MPLTQERKKYKKEIKITKKIKSDSLSRNKK